MTIALTAYDTPPCRGYKPKMAGLITKVERDAQLNWDGSKLYLLGTSRFTEADLGTFLHPITLGIPRSKTPLTCVDVRHFGAVDKRTDNYVVRNNLEYSFATLRGSLQHHWVNQSAISLRNVGPFAVNIFSKWVSTNVARRFSLDPAEQLNVAIAAGIYYQSLFVDNYKIDDEEMVRLSNVLARSIRVKAEDVMAICDLYGSEEAIEMNALIRVMQQIAPVRLNKFNEALLYTILGNTWFNSNAAETLVVALYHPPTWLAILTMCVDDRTYQKSGISRLIQGTRDDSMADTIRAIRDIVNL